MIVTVVDWNALLLQFATEGYVLLKAMDICGITTSEEVPASFPTLANSQQQMAWVRRLSQRIMRYCWLGPLAEDMETAAKAYDDPTVVSADGIEESLGYCVCGEGEYLQSP